MTFDRTTNTIRTGPNSDFIADAGVFFIGVVLKDLAAKPEAPNQIKEDWRLIEKWLGAEGREISRDDEEKISNAWKAYICLGRPPSESLRTAFSKLSQSPDRQKHLLHLPPPEIIDAFDRVLATDSEIAEKKARFVDSKKSPTKDSSGIFRLINNLSKPQRTFIVGTIAWIIWVALRTNDDFELLGFYFERWDEDMFIVNLISLPAIAACGFYAYKWISK